MAARHQAMYKLVKSKRNATCDDNWTIDPVKKYKMTAYKPFVAKT
jgi:hypothetical protein